MMAAFLAMAVVAAASVAFYFGTTVYAAQTNTPKLSAPKTSASQPLPKSFSLPMFFEPNQGQTDPQVKFLARGSGYGLFLTADEAVLKLHRSASSSQSQSNSVIRMRLDGANSSARVSGASPLPGKSSYYIGNDPSKWRSGIPQFARVEYKNVYPGVDLVYYGNQGQLEYDFRVAPDADPNQIALSFNGASTHIDSGDLVLSTANGDVRFHAPRIYQPAAAQSTNSSGNADTIVAGSFRQLADNKIGFAIGDYEHSRELVIDPVLTYSTYLGGSGTENFVKVAVDGALNIFVAGSTDSTDFPVTDGSTLTGAQNIFISEIDPLNAGTANSQLIYSIYLGGTGTDSLTGLAVDNNDNIYVAGTTNSSDFPTLNGIQNGPVTGTHGFLSRISATYTKTNPPTVTYSLGYSTYLAGDGVDHVTGLAIDGSKQYAYVTGDTTSSNTASDSAPFPAKTNGYQTVSNSPGNSQFFASKINTGGTGVLSMIYSTYFGGGYPAGAIANGGGITVDPTQNSTSNIYITGTTNMLSGTGPNGEPGFPLYAARQSCLNQAGVNGKCNPNPTTNTDAFIAKINPNIPNSSPLYSTYLGGSGNEVGVAVAVDSSSNAYITGSTNSSDWGYCNGLQCTYAGQGGATNAFVAGIGNLSGTTYPLNYFSYLGGSGPDVGNAILVDSVQGVHVAGSTDSCNLPLSTNTLFSSCSGGGDAFVALLAASGVSTGNYVTYLGGSNLDQGTGIAVDPVYGSAFVAGTTQSSPSSAIPFPITSTAYQPLYGGSQDAFVSRIGASSTLTITDPSTSPSPSPAPLGQPVAFTFNIANTGPDIASGVYFTAKVPATGVTSVAAKITSGGTGSSCNPVQGSTLTCYIPTLSVCTTSCTGVAVEVDVTASATTQPLQSITVYATASANNSTTTVSAPPQTVQIEDFTISATTSTSIINAGDFVSVQVSFCPKDTNLGYSGTITPSQTITPSMVTASGSLTFNPTSIPLSGSACGTTTLGIQSVARPVNTGSLLRQSSFYATWLPIGGLSLAGLGIGASRKRRRWLVGVLLCLVACIILLQPGCSKSNGNSTTTTSGTSAGPYTITISGSAGTGSSHSAIVKIQVR
jgi:hypothetical protein